MKKQLILTAGIVLSACSSNGQNANQSQHGFNAPQNMAGQYQMAGYNAPQSMGGMNAGMNAMGGCAPAAVPTPCQAVPTPCAPAPVPTPCSAGGGFPWALGGAALGAGGLVLLGDNKTPKYVPPFIRPPVKEPIRPIRYLHAQEVGKTGLRSSYMQKEKAYTYGEIGAVNYDAGKRFGGVQTRIGYQSANIIGAELEGSLGIIKDKNVNVNDLSWGEKKMTGIDHSIAGFATARLPVTDRVKVMARVGYHSTKATYIQNCAKVADVPVNQEQQAIFVQLSDREQINTVGCENSDGTSVTKSGVAFGGGLEAALTPVDSIRADVTAYDMGDKFRKAVSVGYLRKF